MNGPERIKTALARGIADRVPHFEMAYNESSIIGIARHFTDNLPPVNFVQRMSIEDKIKLFDALLLMVDELDVDGLTLRILTKNEDLDQDHFKDIWGVTYLLSPAGDSPVVAGPIKTEADLDGFVPPEVSEADMLLLNYGGSKVKGKRGIVMALRCSFRVSWSLMGGLDKLLVAYRRNPPLVHRLMRMTTDYIIQVIDMAATMGTEVFGMDGDLAYDSGSFMSPVQFREFVKPYYIEIVNAARRHNIPIFKHSDGDLTPILPDIIDAGFEGIHPIQPQCMDLAEIKREFGDRVCILGNVDCMYVLTRGTEAEVVADVKRALSQGSAGGGYIITSSNTIHPDVKPENYIAMVKAIRKYGAYEGDKIRPFD
jgi:uroporphyrinogen decarboxylase